MEREMPQTPEPKDVKYEDALKRLEKLVGELDRSELDLETRLKKFEEGTKLARLLLKKLDQAKKKVELLVKNHAGEAALTPFDDGDLADGEQAG
jgi:exodeoxyribonuclease VII small subunit